MRAIGICLSCVLMAGPAVGEIRILEYQALVGGVSTPFNSIASPGAPAFGRISFDSDAPDTDPDPHVGNYSGAIHEFTIGSYSGSSTGSVIQIVDDGSLPAFDAFQVVDSAPADELDPIGSLEPASVVVAINGSTDLYLGDALPDQPPSLADPRVLDAFVMITVVPPGGDETPLFADLQALPEPAGAAGAALLALLALGASPSRGGARC